MTGGCLPRGVSDRGVSVQGGGCLPRGSARRGCLPRGVSKHALRQIPPSVDRMTDRCKNITFEGGNNEESFLVFH